MMWLWIVLTLVAGYFALIRWLVFGRGEFQFVDNAFMAWVLCNFAGRMQCITIGARCYGWAKNWQIQLTPARRAHERFHFTHQWRAYPYTFLFRYYYQLARYGYDAHPMEEQARLAAGEPSRVSP